MAGDTGRNSPMLGGSRRERDPRLWADLIGTSGRQRRRAVRTIQALEQTNWYIQQLRDALLTLNIWQRVQAGDALSLLGDPRFTPPHYLPEMIHVPAGTAVLGDAGYPAETPVHQVSTGGFSLGQYPVTEAAYRVFVEETGYKQPPHWTRQGPDSAQLNAPVVRVSTRDAEAYCGWLTRITGHNYRLPTEPEWMLAARGDEGHRAYPWGDNFDQSRTNAWSDDPVGRRCAVGLFDTGRGPYGHHDLAGNVWEWCSSLFWRYPYHADDGRENPAADDQPRVMHGGSWRSRPNSVRCSTRQGELPGDRLEVVGFRVARSGD